MPSLARDREQPGIDHAGEMSARGLRCHARDRRQFAGGEGTAIDKHIEHAGARRIARTGGHDREFVAGCHGREFDPPPRTAQAATFRRVPKQAGSVALYVHAHTEDAVSNHERHRTISIRDPTAPASSGLAGLNAMVAALLAWFPAAIRRRQGRKELAQLLDDHLLRDIGLTRHDIECGRTDRCQTTPRRDPRLALRPPPAPSC